MPDVSAKPPTCQVCGRPLSRHRQAVAVSCEQPSCQRVQLRRELATRALREQRWRESADGWRREMIEPSREEPAEAWPVVILPVNERRITHRSEKRTRRFRSHLLRVVSRASEQRFSGAPRATDEPGSQFQDEVRDPAQLPTLGNGCATCRGHCCAQGGETAFLHVETIRRYMDQHPERRPAQIVQDYLSYLQPRTYEGSCVYHGRHGCHLPRAMRSRICNVYLCPGLHELHAKINERPSNQAVVVAATPQRLVRASVLLPDDQFREVPQPTVPDPPDEQAEVRRRVF